METGKNIALRPNQNWNEDCQIQQSMRSLHWRHNDRDGVSNHRRFDCLLNRLFRHRSKKTSECGNTCVVYIKTTRSCNYLVSYLASLSVAEYDSRVLTMPNPVPFLKGNAWGSHVILIRVNSYSLVIPRYQTLSNDSVHCALQTGKSDLIYDNNFKWIFIISNFSFEWKEG